MALSPQQVRQVIDTIPNDRARAAMRDHIDELQEGADLRGTLLDFAQLTGRMVAEAAEQRHLNTRMVDVAEKCAGALTDGAADGRFMGRLVEKIQGQPAVIGTSTGVGMLLLYLAQIVAAQIGVPMPTVGGPHGP